MAWLWSIILRLAIYTELKCVIIRSCVHRAHNSCRVQKAIEGRAYISFILLLSHDADGLNNR